MLSRETETANGMSILSSGGGLRSEYEAPSTKEPETLESLRKAQSSKHGSWNAKASWNAVVSYAIMLLTWKETMSKTFLNNDPSRPRRPSDGWPLSPPAAPRIHMWLAGVLCLMLCCVFVFVLCAGLAFVACFGHRSNAMPASLPSHAGAMLPLLCCVVVVFVGA